ncbi:MAG: hypothetical protein ACK5MT_09495 [Actinomycetales bacterium]
MEATPWSPPTRPCSPPSPARTATWTLTPSPPSAKTLDATPGADPTRDARHEALLDLGVIDPDPGPTLADLITEYLDHHTHIDPHRHDTLLATLEDYEHLTTGQRSHLAGLIDAAQTAGLSPEALLTSRIGPSTSTTTTRIHSALQHAQRLAATPQWAPTWLPSPADPHLKALHDRIIHATCQATYDTLDNRPSWLTCLGPEPTDENAHADCLTHLATITAYRHHYNITTPHDPYGPEPTDPTQRTDWLACQNPTNTSASRVRNVITDIDNQASHSRLRDDLPSPADPAGPHL